ncbi:methyltransferase protein [Vigna angularis]|uniref:Methyltransferase n=1 Tax=Phaseolus angularis TaxID=3914 RepID=A0A8T0L9N2_PHAAN|nr:methyltransferase protein [Vigna angularis]
MGIWVERLLRERKCPFFLTLLVFVVCVSILTFTKNAASNLDPIGFYLDVKAQQPLAHFSSPAPKRQRLPLKGEPFLDDANIDWKLCKGHFAFDYVPCLDNLKVIKALRTRRHMEHRERHCPHSPLHCLVPLPRGYKLPLPWPKSRDMVRLILRCFGFQIWYDNVPHPKLVEYKKEQNWVVKSGDYLVFPGGGTQFKEGVNHYTEYIEKLTFPDNGFDLVHCARCRVHWDADGGKPLFELNRILRPGGFFAWSATPVYRDDERDRKVWNAMVTVTKAMCWSVVAKTLDSSGIGLVIYQKPTSSSCYQERKENTPPLCEYSDKKSVSSWYAKLSGCLIPLPVDGEDVYIDGLSINWSSVRNVMDMNAGYAGCEIVDVVVEIDRILRPDGYVLVQDTVEMMNKLGPVLHSLHWSVTLYQNRFLVGKKSFWRPRP